MLGSDCLTIFPLVAGCLELCRRSITDRAQEPLVIIPVDPFRRRAFDLVNAFARSSCPDDGNNSWRSSAGCASRIVRRRMATSHGLRRRRAQSKVILARDALCGKNNVRQCCSYWHGKDRSFQPDNNHVPNRNRNLSCQHTGNRGRKKQN